MSNSNVVGESEPSLAAIFRRTANLISQCYSQSVNNQNLAFQAGYDSAIMEMQDWITEQLQDGKIITIASILDYVQAKMEFLARAEEQLRQLANGSGQTGASALMVSSSSPMGLATSSFAPPDEGNNPGVAACPIGPQDQDIAELARLFAPGDQDSHLKMARMSSSQEHDIPQEMQLDEL